MGKKSSSKHIQQGAQTPPPTAQQTAGKGLNPFLIAAIVVVLGGVGFLAFWNAGPTDAVSNSAAASTGAATPPADASTAPASNQSAKGTLPVEFQQSADALARLGPHQQKNLPPIPFNGFAPPPRPREVITEAYLFAAEHPEVLSYIPCFCGCERSGHRGNHDCFIKSRAVNGDVIAWDEHGIECTVCIDVATRSRQLFNSGASVSQIRTAIEKQYAQAQVMTPTGIPPGHAH